jgi:hypothetical protein
MSRPPQEPGDDARAADPAPPTSDPADAGPEPTGEPVDPAISTATPDPGQTGRDER